MIFISEFLRGTAPLKQTENLRVEKIIPLIEPTALKLELPMTPEAEATVSGAREAIRRILSKQDKRLIVIAGPCSIHDEASAIEYAEKLADLKKKIGHRLLLVMRVYCEKPRTNLGWKGLINDPFMDCSYDMNEGFRRARRLMLKINELGIPVATEMLDPMTPRYIADLVSWAAIGARTTESQTHRQMASGLDMPVGFKNSTDGSLGSAINAMKAAASSQSFSGIDKDGRACIIRTDGNRWGHLVLRGGKRPNYDSVSIEDARMQLRENKLPDAIIVDCSHGNSGKIPEKQADAWKETLRQRNDGNDAIVGMMLESHIHEGKQKLSGNPCSLQYGVSITDACMSWEMTERLILSAASRQ